MDKTTNGIPVEDFTEGALYLDVRQALEILGESRAYKIVAQAMQDYERKHKEFHV